VCGPASRSAPAPWRCVRRRRRCVRGRRERRLSLAAAMAQRRPSTHLSRVRCVFDTFHTSMCVRAWVCVRLCVCACLCMCLRAPMCLCVRVRLYLCDVCMSVSVCPCVCVAVWLCLTV
jgi:hypothetical protein